MVVAAVGLAVTLAVLAISFFPSSDLDAQANAVYQATLAVSFAVSVAIPFVIYECRGHWVKPKDMHHVNKYLLQRSIHHV